MTSAIENGSLVYPYNMSPDWMRSSKELLFLLCSVGAARLELNHGAALVPGLGSPELNESFSRWQW